MTKTLTLIKLGGSIITNKRVPGALRQQELQRLVAEIALAKRERSDELFIVGHGQGSFAHVPASKYQTKEGFINQDSVLGMAIVQDSAAQLNRIVVQEFLKQNLPAVSCYASNSIVTKKRQAVHFSPQVLEEYLKQGLLPVTCGDVLVDQEQGCTIWSTEQILAFLADYFKKQGFMVNKVVHVTEVDGFLDKNGQVVKNINQHNWQDISRDLYDTQGFDVTGGMLLKVAESLSLAKQGIKSMIISGLRDKNLYQSLSDREFVGTLIA